MQDGSLYRIFGQDDHNFWGQVIENAKEIREIRLRIRQPVLVRWGGRDCFVDELGHFTDRAEEAHRMSQQEMDDFFMHICHGSPYAFEDMVRQGFLTVPGGHRIGLTGQVVQGENGGIQTIKHLYYANIRIAHEIHGIADEILPQLYPGGDLQNTLIVSPPGKGKTTMLRELIRSVSEGNPYDRGRNVGVVDERSELAGSYLGKPQNDLGCRTDVLDACPKAQGMFLLLRSMAPEVLAVDELGNRGDVEALRAAAVCGTKVIATVHGIDLEDVARRFPELLRDKLFECFVLFREQEGKNAGFGRNNDPRRQCGSWIVVSGQVYRQNTGSENVGENPGIVSKRDQIWQINHG